MDIQIDYNDMLRRAAELAGQKIADGVFYSEQGLWEELSCTTDEMPGIFKTILEDQKYKKLVELYTRKVAIKNIEHVSFVRGILTEIAMLANTSMLEDLILNPGDIDFSQRRLLAKDLNKLIGADAPAVQEIEGEEEKEPAEESVAVTALDEEERLQKLLNMYPEEMHETIIKRWKLERLKSISVQEHRLRSAM